MDKRETEQEPFYKKEDYSRKMKPLEWLENAWFYYKIHIFGVLVIAYVVFSFTSAVLSPRADALTIAWLAGQQREEVFLAMAEELTETLAPYEYTSDGVIVREFHLMEDEFHFNMAMRTSFGTLVSTREIDIVIAVPGEYWLEGMNPMDHTRDIRQMLAYAGLEVAEERLLSAENSNGNIVYFGVLLEGSPILARYGIADRNRYIAVVQNTAREEAALLGLRMFLE